MNDIEELSKEFHSLQGNGIPEKRKYLNYYIERIRANVKNGDDLNILTKSIKPKNALERSFKVEILLRLQRNDQVLDILKGVDIELNAKIYKNWKFFSEVFSNMDCHTFFTDVTPYISHSSMMKILTRMSKLLRSEVLADEYFNALHAKYGLELARRIMPACSIDLVKDATHTYKICLTSKELLIFAKKDKDFLRFYFNIPPAFYIRAHFEDEYKKIAQYVGRTDADLFWKLYGIFNFNNPNIEINLGESVFDFLFAHDEFQATNREICANMFNPRRVYNVLTKRGKLDVLLANFCHGEENEFYKIYAEQEGREFYSLIIFLDRMPKYNYFRYLNGAFKLKFGKDLSDYPKYFNKNIMKITPTPEREQVLDLLVKENDDLLYFYDVKKSIPLLKRILDEEVENPDPYLKQLYRSCKRQRDELVLLDVLKYLTDKYRHREHLIDEICMKIVRWSNAEKFKPEIWSLIDEMVKIVEYSDDIFYSSGFTDYIRKHIINSADNNVPFDKLFKEMLNRRTGDFLDFQTNKANVKRYLEEAGKLMINMRKKDDFDDVIDKFFSRIFQFNNNYEGDAISLLNYGHFVEMAGKNNPYYFQELVQYGARHNIHDSFHDLFWNKVDIIYDRSKYVVAYARNQSDIFLKNMVWFDWKSLDLLREIPFENFTAEMKSKLYDYCLHILTLSDEYNADRVASALELLSIINEEAFINAIRHTNLIKLHKRQNSKKIIKVLSKYLRRRRSSDVANMLPLAVYVYKNTEIKNYLAPIQSYLHKIPLDQAKGITKLFSEQSTVRLRRLSVTLAYIFLTNAEMHAWIREMNKKESDRSVKRHLCKKAFYLFLKNQNDANWSLIKDNIDLVGNDFRGVLESWSMLPLISPEYCEKYVTHSFNVVSKDGNIEWHRKKMLKLMRPPVHRNLSLAFLKDILEEIPLYTMRTQDMKHVIISSFVPKDNYYIEFWLHTSGEKQNCLLEFIFEKLKMYVDDNWRDFPENEVFSNVYEFLRAFCKCTLRQRPKHELVKTFYDKWKSSFPPTYFQSKFLLLDFLYLLSECQYEIEQFSKKSSDLLKIFVDRYGTLIHGIYCDQLVDFIDAADIDQFSFLFGFVEGKTDPVTYSAVIKMLPGHCSIFYTDEPKLEKLRCILRNCNDPVVNLHLSIYLEWHY